MYPSTKRYIPNGIGEKKGGPFLWKPPSPSRFCPRNACYFVMLLLNTLLALSKLYPALLMPVTVSV